MEVLHLSRVAVVRWSSNAQDRWMNLQLWAAAMLLAVSLFSAHAAEQPVPVTVAVVEKRAIDQEIPLSGSVLARRRSELSSEIDALVAEVPVEEGDAVKRGDVLIRLDATLAEFEALTAAAALEEARSRYKEALRQRDEAARLINKKYVAETDYKAKISEAHTALAVLNRLQADYRRRAELVKRHVIRAPFAGVVSKKEVEVGEWAEAGSLLLELVEIDRLRIDVPVPQRYFARIRRDSPVRLRFDAFPERWFDATVTFKIPVGHAAARTFPVRIEIDNSDRLVAPGMSARVVFLLQSNEPVDAALMLPRDAIVRLPDGTGRVWRVESDNGMTRVGPVAIVTGRSFGALVEMKSGALTQGDRIVVRGNESLKSGQRVRIVGG
jgi:membrane fusion protein, multidrug efflux system